jgi:hypothetical protein
MNGAHLLIFVLGAFCVGLILANAFSPQKGMSFGKNISYSSPSEIKKKQGYVTKSIFVHAVTLPENPSEKMVGLEVFTTGPKTSVIPITLTKEETLQLMGMLEEVLNKQEADI